MLFNIHIFVLHSKLTCFFSFLFLCPQGTTNNDVIPILYKWGRCTFKENETPVADALVNVMYLFDLKKHILHFSPAFLNNYLYYRLFTQSTQILCHCKMHNDINNTPFAYIHAGPGVPVSNNRTKTKQTTLLKYWGCSSCALLLCNRLTSHHGATDKRQAVSLCFTNCGAKFTVSLVIAC